MTTINAHFDGKVFVPDEPCDLPVGTPLRVHVEFVPRHARRTADELLAPVIVGLDPTLAQAIASDPDFAARIRSGFEVVGTSAGANQGARM